MKWADYLISHVEHDTAGRVKNVKLHTDNGDTVTGGVTKSKDEVIALLKRDYSVETILWTYPNWRRGAKVDYIRETNGYEYLRTVRDKTAKDNLDNLIPL